MITNDNLSPSDLLIAELKQKGLKNKEIAVQVFPELPLKSAEVKVSRHLQKHPITKLLAQTKEQAMTELKVNWYELLNVFTDALEAKKTVVHGNAEDAWVEVLPDHTIRMNAAKELIKHLPLQTPSATSPLDEMNLSDMDEVELNQAIFRRTT